MVDTEIRLELCGKTCGSKPAARVWGLYMSRRRILKLIHLVGTAWLILCVGCLIVLKLREAGVRWAVILPFSGHAGVLTFLLVSLHFAIFRGVDRSQKIEVEHPLTTADCYTGFYVATPFLGSIAGLVGGLGNQTVTSFLSHIGLGTLGMTFLVWMIVDPAAGLAEMLVPASRRHRRERLAKLRAVRRQHQRQREELLASVFERERQQHRHWQEVLAPHAERLAGLLADSGADFARAEREAIDIGVNAWQIGGIECMRQLRDMAMDISRQASESRPVVDYISFWWDGVGNWRPAGLVGQACQGESSID